MRRLTINASVAVILGLGIGLALVWVLGGGSTPIAAAPVLSGVEGPARIADVPSAIEGPRAEGDIEAQSAPVAEGSTELAEVLHVCFGGCLYSSIQDAVDAAGDGDVIKVAAGTYTGVSTHPAPPGYDYPPPSGLITQVVYISKTVTVRGGYTTDDWNTSDPENNPTTLDAEGQGRVFLIAGHISPTVEGLRITGGDAIGLSSVGWRGDAGGGVYVLTATAIIRDNQVFSNTASNGGGLYLENSDATLSGNTITTNSGSGLYLENSDATLSGNTISANGGGGLFLWYSDATLSGNTVSGNTAYDGGGLSLWYSDATLSGNTVSGNTANYGGGLSLWYSDATLSGNAVSSNIANRGGGLSLWRSDATLRSNAIISNTAERDGGGLFLFTSNAILNDNTIYDNSSNLSGGGLYLSGSDVTSINNVIAHNRANTAGSGLYVGASSTRLVHTTIAGNGAFGGSGVYVTVDGGCWGSLCAWGRGTVALTNTIIVNHSVGISVTDWNTLTGNGILWHNSPITISQSVTAFVTVQNQYVGDPAFVDPDNGDYHIMSGSAAIDAGVDAGVDYDIDGEPRPAAFGFDIGADEQPGASLHMRKAARPPLINPGQTLTYTLFITSVGVDTATDVQLTDTLPTLQRAVAIATSQGSCTTGPGWGSTATCDVGILPPGASVHITLTAQVTTTLPARLPWPMRNTAWVRSAEASNATYADTALHDCHVRLNDSPTEYSAVQEGVDASTYPNDVVKVSGYCVAMNSRAGLPQIVYLDKTLTLQGGWNSAFTQRDGTAFPTTLDARGQGRVLYITVPASDVPISATIEGLRITDGDATGLGGSSWERDAGGGVYVLTATAIIRDNQVFGNTARDGGGLYLEDSDATIGRNTITGNSGRGLLLYSSDAMLTGNTITDNSGGGLYLDNSTAAFIGNTFANNTAEDGGGLLLWSSITTLSGNTVKDNTAGWKGGGLLLFQSAATLSGNTISGNTAHKDGGGVYLSRSGLTTFTGDTVSNNTAERDGGGMYLNNSNATLNRNLITSNTANGDGGGLYLTASPATLINNVVADNQVLGNVGSEGSGIYINASSPRLLHTTIAHNRGSDGSGDGSALYVTGYDWSGYSTIVMTNTVLASHSVGINVTEGNTVTVNGVLWHHTPITIASPPAAFVMVQNQHTGDPAFVDPDNADPSGRGDYHIGPGSAAIDAGVGAGVDHDIDGEPRPLGGGYDLGADEIGLFVAKQATPDPIRPGAQLTYTIHITNVTGVDLHATITDTLPLSVTLNKASGGTLALPGGTVVMPDGRVAVTWTTVITTPDGLWTGTIIVTVDEGYSGPLTNLVEVTTKEGVVGKARALVNARKIFLPLVVRTFCSGSGQWCGLAKELGFVPQPSLHPPDLLR